MKLYRARQGIVLESGNRAVRLENEDWDQLLNRRQLPAYLRRRFATGKPVRFSVARAALLPPVVSQEVWAAGVTYYRSRRARELESSAAGGGNFYTRVYNARRPELFLKATPHRVSAHRQPVRIRRDSKWNVPEPELAVVASAAGEIVGWTICNDMSSRDIEGANPLYLPQAKTYRQCCGLGPGILVQPEMPPRATAIEMQILRKGNVSFSGSTTLKELKRSPVSLLEWLFRENEFPAGVILSTGTGIVPPNDFALRPGDEIQIRIEPIGTLSNVVVRG